MSGPVPVPVRTGIDIGTVYLVPTGDEEPPPEKKVVASTTLTVILKDAGKVNISLNVSTLTVNEGSTGTISVSLSRQPAGTVTVYTRRVGTAFTASPSTLTFTTANWNTAQDVTVTPRNDDDTNDETGYVYFDAYSAVSPGYTGIEPEVKVTITDDDTSIDLVVSESALTITEGESDDFTVKMSSQPTGSVTVTISGHTDTDVTLNNSTLTFTTSNWNTVQTVRVTTAEDDTDYEDDNVRLVLSSTGGGFTGSDHTVNVTISDDDEEPERYARVTPNPADVVEGSSVQVGMYMPEAPSASVTWTVTSDNSDLSFDDSDLVFTTTNYNSWQYVNVSAADDNDADSETATLTWTASSTDTDIHGSTVTQTVNIEDNEGNHIHTLVRGSRNDEVQVLEGSTATFSIRLSRAPTGNVSVTISGFDTSKITVAPTSLTFTATNWGVAQEVTITAKSDSDTVDGSDTISITAMGGGYTGNLDVSPIQPVVNQ